jgi:hypothetical protein
VGGSGEPIAVGDGFVPGDSYYGLLRVRKVRVAPEWRWQFSRRPEEAGVVIVGDLMGSEVEGVD